MEDKHKKVGKIQLIVCDLDEYFKSFIENCGIKMKYVERGPHGYPEYEFKAPKWVLEYMIRNLYEDENLYKNIEEI